MAYPSKIAREDILTAAAEIVASEGVKSLSMSGLGKRLGVKAPSLYRYIDGKADILQALTTETIEELASLMERVLQDAPDEPEEQLIAVGLTYRTYAHQHPKRYLMAMGESAASVRPTDADLIRLALPLRAIIASIAGVRISMPALQGVWSLLHGFVMLELSGHFPPGGDADEAFIQCVAVYVKGWQGWAEEMQSQGQRM